MATGEEEGAAAAEGAAEEVAQDKTEETKNDAEENAEVIDIDLNDPQTEEAAVKIQVCSLINKVDFQIRTNKLINIFC